MNQGFYDELARRLKKAGFSPQAVDSEGFTPVQWQGRLLCQVTPSGGVRFQSSDMKDNSFETARNQVYDIAQTVAKIQALMEKAPTIKAKGLEGDYSYASSLTSYGATPHDILADFPLIDQASRRLGKVVLENQDFERLIRHFDRDTIIFYCDPPYHATEGYYQNIGEDGFTEKDHIRLRDTLLSIDGKFLLSYNDDAFVREIYDHEGIYIEPVTRLNNIRQRYDPNCQFEELLISNYDTAERKRAVVQLTIFDDFSKEDQEDEGFQIHQLDQ